MSRFRHQQNVDLKWARTQDVIAEVTLAAVAREDFSGQAAGDLDVRRVNSKGDTGAGAVPIMPLI